VAKIYLRAEALPGENVHQFSAGTVSDTGFRDLFRDLARGTQGLTALVYWP
jgi:hypothetical protein